MTDLDPRKTHITLSSDEAEYLQQPPGQGYTVEIRPPRQQKQVPASLPGFIKGITEFQTRILGLGNTSPTTVYEIRRSTNDDLRLQFTVPTKRLERKLRTQLTNTIPDIGFKDGTSGLPVAEDSTVGGGLLYLGRPDFFPLRTRFDDPPVNALVSALHRHAFPSTGVIIQVLFTPVVGQPVRYWWWKKQAYKRRNYLKKEKEKLWGNRSPTKRERTQAQQVDTKAGNARYKTSIRLLFTDADEYTPSRVKELAGAFNIYENPDTGQYLNAVTVRSFRRSQILRFAQAVANRKNRGWTRSFRTTPDELAALISIPTTRQENLDYSQ